MIASALEFCSSCSCESCVAHREAMAIFEAVSRGEAVQFWSCRCGWLYPWTASNRAKYGEVSECNRCCSESIIEVASNDFRILAAIAAIEGLARHD